MSALVRLASVYEFLIFLFALTSSEEQTLDRALSVREECQGSKVLAGGYMSARFLHSCPSVTRVLQVDMAIDGFRPQLGLRHVETNRTYKSEELAALLIMTAS